MRRRTGHRPPTIKPDRFARARGGSAAPLGRKHRSLVTRLIDDGEEFVRAELKLYRARLFSRLDEARNAIILAVIALSLVQAVMVAALVGVLIVLRRPLGPGGATAVVVVAGLALAGLLGLAWPSVS